jgi:hypothetical protein
LIIDEEKSLLGEVENQLQKRRYQKGHWDQVIQVVICMTGINDYQRVTGKLKKAIGMIQTIKLYLNV